MKSAVYIILFLCLIVDSGYTLRCYSCSAPMGYRSDCERRVNTNTVATTYCSYGYNTCMTLRMRNAITRACAQSNVCQLYQNSPEFQSCSTCVTDLCNNRSSKISSFALPLGVFVLFYVTLRAITY